MSAVKLLMSWDIKSGREAAYFDFVVREFAPAMMQLGLQPTEAWYTVYGRGPQILTGAVAKNVEAMMDILSSQEWHDLVDELMEHVHNYEQKVVEASGRFQL